MARDPRKYPGERQSWKGGSITWNEGRQRYVVSIEGPPDRVTGQRRRMYGTAMTYHQAREKVDELKLKKANLEGATSSKVKLSDWLDEWLESRRQRVTPNTHQTYRRAIEGGIKPYLGQVRLSDLTVRKVEKMGEAITQERTPHQARYAHSVLAMALRGAVRQGLIPFNPAGREGAEKPAVARKQDTKRLDLEQAMQLLLVARRMPDNLFTRWATALITGLRQGEVLGLTWDRVDLESGFMDVSWQLQLISWDHGCGKSISPQKYPCRRTAKNCPQAKNPLDIKWFEWKHLHDSLYLVKPKSKSSERRVPIPPILVEYLKEHKRETEFDPNPHNLVWCRPSGVPYQQRADHENWVKLLEEAGLPKVKLHSARHTAATVLASLGLDLTAIQRVLGHSSINMTQIYSDIDFNRIRGYMDQLSGKIILGEVTVEDPKQLPKFDETA